MLAVEAADYPLYAPGLIVASVVRGDKVFILRQILPSDIAAPSVCSAPVSQVLQNWENDPTDRNQLALDYQRCFVEHLQEQGYYATVVREAQALVDRVAAN
jgi:hypothetical protein